jgi:hypothetical protein
VRLIEVATGISRNMLSKLHFDCARRVELEDLAKPYDFPQGFPGVRAAL